MYERDQLFIDGKWTAPESPDAQAAISVISPHSEQVIGHAACAGPADVTAPSMPRGRHSTPDRGPECNPPNASRRLNRLAGIYKERRADMAALISAEIGAPITFAKMAQVRLPLTMLLAFCGFAGNYEWQQERPGLYGKNIRIVKQPVGVVAAVVPWNMPQFLTVTKVAPALLAGCSVVLKPAPESVLDAQLLAEMVAAADLPPGCLECGSRWPRRRRAAGEPPRCRQGLLHRVHGGRPPGGPCLRRGD